MRTKMEELDIKQLEKINDLKVPIRKNKKQINLQELKDSMNMPLDVQKELAAKLKLYVDVKLEEEWKDKGYITESTRKWVEVLNNLLDKMHKEMYGDKHTNMNVHIVTHSDISTKLRNITL